MSYSSTADFLALLRQTSGGQRIARMPGLDYVIAALARMGMISLWTASTAPTTNQASTVWLLPSSPSWVAEGTVFLWDAITSTYEPATAALWSQFLSGSGPGAYSFFSATAASNTVPIGTSLVAIQRVAPVTTLLTLPSVAAQFATGRPLKIADWSSGVTGHTTTIVPAGGNTIMRLSSWQLYSSDVSLSGATLHASPDLNGWVIAP